MKNGASAFQEYASAVREEGFQLHTTECLGVPYNLVTFSVGQSFGVISSVMLSQWFPLWASAGGTHLVHP